MKLSLRVYYTIHSIPIIHAFVCSVAEYFGANQKEIFELGLVAEEASEHIIKAYPSEDIDSPFDIYCEKENDNLRFTFSNTGFPVDEDNIPQYDISHPEQSVDGLQFFLIEKLTDSFKFVNLGSAGWQTVIEKKLQFAKEIMHKNSDEGNEVKGAPQGKLTLGMATPEDAYQITKLSYHTYRYSYAKKTFYYPELLREKLASQQIISLIIKNEKKEIVAHLAFLRSDECQNIAEAGAIMTMPEYRMSSAVMRLTKEASRFLRSDRNPGIEIADSNLVTAHTGSQRICRAFKFIPTAFKISVHERAQFIDIKDVSMDRETLVYSILPVKTPEKFVVYLPQVHREIISEIFDTAGFKYELANTDEKISLREKSKFMIQRNEETNFATIVVLEIGEDLLIELKKISYQLSLENMLTVALKIPIWEQLTKDINHKLSEINFFFSGVLPSTTTKWQILYTCLKNHQINFKNIKVTHKLAEKLRDYIEECYHKVIPS